MKVTIVVDVPLEPVARQGEFTVEEFKVEWTDDSASLGNRTMALYEKGEKKIDNTNEKQKYLLWTLFEPFTPKEWDKDLEWRS